MPAYSWVLSDTKHFGSVWLPVAKIQLLTSSGMYRPFAFQIDSGAVVSLVKRSVADHLGLSLEAGRCVDLVSVGGKVTNAFVHDLRVKLDDGIEFTAPFAIAESEDVPMLLGRLGIFDRLAVSFDPIVRRTFIQRPN